MNKALSQRSQASVYLANAQIVDGTNAPGYLADIEIHAGLIVGIHPIGNANSQQHLARPPTDQTWVDCTGLTIAPGFIDVHTHDDALVLQPCEAGAFHPKLSQGVTSVITGNCGVSLAPLITESPPAPLDILGCSGWRFASFVDYLHAVNNADLVVNVACMIGHTTLRAHTLSDLSKPASNAEQLIMRAQVQAALHAGAIGVSTGVYYPPARAATTEEVVSICGPLKEFSLPVAMHLRDEGDAIDQAMQEAFAIGRAAECTVILSHHKIIGAQNAGRSKHTLAAFDLAAKSQSVCMDCYPYDASSTMLFTSRVEQSRDVLITWSSPMPEAKGQLISELAAQANITIEAMADQLQPAGAIYFAMDEGDVREILLHPETMIGSDGLAHDANPHPRLWGSFTRVLGRYSRQLNLFPLETAIYKMTGLSAKRFGLDQASHHRPARGQIQVGWAADLVVFDAQTVIDNADYQQPQQASSGIAQVYVNGVLAALDGRTLHARAGALLRNTQYV